MIFTLDDEAHTRAIEGPQFCCNCGDRCFRKVYIISNENYCYKCIKEKFAVKVIDRHKGEKMND